MNSNQSANIVGTVIQLILGGFVSTGVLSHNESETIGAALLALVTFIATHNWHGKSGTPKPPLAVILICAGMLALTATGCVSQSKFTRQSEPFKAPIVQSDCGDILYPASYYSVTNASGQVMTYPVYAAAKSPNKAPWSLKRFLWGGDHELATFTDLPEETHSGKGKAVLVDSTYNQVDSKFSSGSRFNGNSSLGVGNLSNVVSTNGIRAVGSATADAANGIGGAVGTALGKAVKTP